MSDSLRSLDELRTRSIRPRSSATDHRGIITKSTTSSAKSRMRATS
jgi:hypothetical protein